MGGNFALVCLREGFQDFVFVAAGNTKISGNTKICSVVRVPDGGTIDFIAKCRLSPVEFAMVRIQQILEKFRIAAIERYVAAAVTAVIGNPDTSIVDAKFPTTLAFAWFAVEFFAAPLEALGGLAIDIKVKIHLDFAVLKRNVVAGEVVDIATLAALGRLGHEVSSSCDLVGTCATILIGLAAKGRRGEGSQDEGGG